MTGAAHTAAQPEGIWRRAAPRRPKLNPLG